DGMIREKLIESGIGVSTKFRMRGREVSRIEALSDAVFGFAITLLVVSLEVPRTFDALMEMMRGFIAFAICFAMLILVWYQQYKFFRRYGLNDALTFVLNAVLLFVVLFYVYPLKFVWTLLVNMALGVDSRVRLPTGELVAPVANSQMSKMMIVFSIGYVAVFAVFMLLYWRAHAKRSELELNPLEVLDTRTELQENLLHMGVGLLSIGLASLNTRGFVALAGFCYTIIGPVMTVHGMLAGKKRKKLEASLTASAADAEPARDEHETQPPQIADASPRA
ncbi:MAG TPA: TMEM175 family protein, partial [Pyrinomonadaceae bacterium]|nr:TMEM175 family protein [Pyrinomonadaceae bacterium]